MKKLYKILLLGGGGQFSGGCVSNNKDGYIDMETTNRGEPKDRNTETVDDL